MSISKVIQEERNDGARLSMQQAMNRERSSRGRDRTVPDIELGPVEDRGFLEREPLSAAAQEDHALRLAAAQRLAVEEGIATDGRQLSPERVPFGEPEFNLYAKPIPGFFQYWFNDVKDRLLRARRAGFEHVQDERGEPICRIVSREGGRDVKAYLMKTPVEWHNADKAASERRESMKIAEIRAGRFQAQPGSNQYVPMTGIQIRENR